MRFVKGPSDEKIDGQKPSPRRGSFSLGAAIDALYVRLRGISPHSLRPRIRLHMAGMADSVSPRGTGAAGPKHIHGRCGSVGIVCATPARAIGTAVEARAFAARGGAA
jgi:hypothetical protein